MSAGTKNLRSQFSVQNIVVAPCPPSFYALLNIEVQVKRSYNTGDGVVNVNEYGEVVIKARLAGLPELISTVKARINAKKGEGLQVDFHGKSVMADFILFLCPANDVQENDILVIGEKEYLVLRVDGFVAYNRVHHLQVFCKNYTTL